MLEKCSCLMPHKLLSESWHFWILRFCFSWHGTPDACFHCETSLLNQTYKMTLFQLNCLKTLISQLVQVSCLMLINHLKCLWQQSQELLRISISREISNIPNYNKTTEISLNQFKCCSIFHFQIHKRKQV